MFGPWSSENEGPLRLVTTQSLLLLGEQLQPPHSNSMSTAIAFSGNGRYLASSGMPQSVVWDVSGMNANSTWTTGLRYYDTATGALIAGPMTAFQQVGQSLWTLLAAGVGAVVAKWFARRKNTL